MSKPITERIEAHYATLSKGQKRIAAVILEGIEKVAYMTAAKLGRLCEVSESTVVRFAGEIGYDGYPEMQNAMRELLRTKLTPNQRIAVAGERLERGDLLQNVLSADIEKIKYTLERTDRTVFAKSVEAILRAERIFIFGSRSSATLAYFLSFNLELILDNVRRIDPTSTGEAFEKLLSIGEKDLLFVSSFPRYSRATIDAARYAHEQGATVLALTDSADSPLAEYADLLLAAQSDMVSFVDSLVAPLSLINALLVSVAKERTKEIEERFDRLEHLWEEYNVYGKQE